MPAGKREIAASDSEEGAGMAVDPSEAQQNPEGGDDLDQAFAELTALIEQEAPPNVPVGGQSVGPDVVNYPVPYFRQSSPSRCWYTSLHMIVAFCRGLNAEFTGHPTALAEGQKRDEERDAIRAQQKRPVVVRGLHGGRIDQACRRRQRRPRRRASEGA